MQIIIGTTIYFIYLFIDGTVNVYINCLIIDRFRKSQKNELFIL